jgi:hypothetical protein
MKRPVFTLTATAVVLIGALFACSRSSSTEPEIPADVQALRANLAPYASFALANNAGYSAALTDCMSNGDVGAMGVHYANTTLIDDKVDPLRPEVLIYEPGTNGAMSLVGVEFVIPFAIRPKTATAPVLFGRAFVPDETFQLWALHVWTHRENPSGLFAPWNPRVHC